MAVTASSVGTGDTLETFRQEFNNAVVDLGNLDSATVSSVSISANNSTDESAFLVFVDGATGQQGLESDTALTYNPSSNLLTIGSLLIADAGSIGSASDTNAITISSGGVVAVTATTANTSASDGALTVGGGLGVAADASIGDDLRLISDSAVLSFGADSDTTLTHTDGSGLTLNSTNKLMFNDASQFIQGASATVLDIAATDEIELTATLIDVVGNLAGSGTGTFGGILKTDDTTEATSTTDGSLQTDGGLSVAKDIVAGDDIKLLSDASVIAFGANGDVTLTHVHDTGILLNSTMAIQFNDASQSINAPSNAILDINATDEIELNATLLDVNANINASGTYTGAGLMTTGGNIVIPDAGNIGSASDTDAIAISSGGVVTFSQTPIFSGDLQVEDDLILDSDGAILSFGEDNEITLTHNHNRGVTLKNTGTADDSYLVLGLQTGETDIQADDIIAALDFSAPDEGTGTDAITVAAAIVAISEGNFAADNNATTLSFRTGLSGSASEKMSLNSAGNLAVSGTIVPTGAITSNAGVVVDNITIDGTEIDLSSGDLTVDVAGDIILDADGGDVFFKDAGTTFGSATNTSGNLIIKSGTTTAATFSGANVTFAGTIGSGNITSTGTLQGTTITATTAVVPDASDGAALGTTALEWSDLFIADGGIIYFGDDQEITLTHVADVGLNLKHTATADDKPIILTLQTGETDMQANDVLGEIRWQAPDEGTGTDAIAIAASIVAISEGNFAADNNATKMEFRLGSSEAATQKATLSSNGNFQVDGTLTCDPLATLLIKDSSGSTLKTINGVTSN
ncbi:hypothetical protein [uncultured Mediterranean phage]|nr:hypothetical protein [uncultured Mediterranean phage]